jgi:hypothetical protein
MTEDVKKPSNTAQKSKPDATKQTVRDQYAEALANDPRFKKAPKTGKGFIIGGVKRPDTP